jgi:hypothetical protein
MADEYVEWKLSLLKIAAGLALLDMLELAISIGGAYALWRRVARR